MNITKKLLAMLLGLSVTTLSINAGIIFEEDFNYADGTGLEATLGWSQHSGTASEDITVQNNSITLRETSGYTADMNYSLGDAVSSGALYFAFDISVASSSAYTGTSNDHEYFAHWGTNASFTSRVDLDLSGTGFTLGIASVSSTAEVTLPSEASFDTTYRLVVEYDFTTKISTLWLDPVTSESSNISTSAAGVGSSFAIDDFSIRQAGAAGSPAITIDNLIVSDDFASAVPEPSTYALLAGLTGLTFVMLKRRVA